MFRRRSLGFVLAGCLATCAAAPESLAGEIVLHARSRVETAPGSGEFRTVEKRLTWDAAQTAIVVCDMWDHHWCQGAERRVGAMAPHMNEVLHAARKLGVQIVHCPSSCLKPYEGAPQRKLAQQAPPVKTTIPLEKWVALTKGREAPLPIDDSDNGCDCLPRCKHGAPWTKQIETLDIESGDAITDSAEAFYLMRQKGLKNVIVMGVHANICVLGRPFSIRQLVNQGQNVVLMRDLTDSMYNPRKRPYVDHFRGTELVVEHVEKYWCPTVTSSDFTGRPAFSWKEDERPHAAFVVGEDEYETKDTLPAFAEQELAMRGFRCTFLHANPDDPHDFPGLDGLESADLLVLSVRRRAPKADQLERIRRYAATGKPIVALRTTSHAFALRPDQAVPAGHAVWPEFDAQVLGGNYQGHHNNKELTDPKTFVRVDAKEPGHAILQGVPTEETYVRSWLYKTSPLAPTATPLMTGRVEGRQPEEPVAWTNVQNGGRVFYTSLGHPDDFKLPLFRRLLLNGCFWAIGREVPNYPEAPAEAGK